MGLDDDGWSPQHGEGFLDFVRDVCTGPAMVLALIAVLAAPWAFLFLIWWVFA